MTQRNKGGRPAKPIEMPDIPKQERPAADGLVWYLTQAKRTDGAFIQDLVKRLIGQGYAAWCPYGLVTRSHAGKKTIKLEPLFAPLIFVGLQVGQQGIATMTKTIGVVDVVRSDTRKPLSISAHELGKLWDDLQEHGGARPLQPPSRRPWFKEGDAVKMKDSMWAGMEGVFSWCRGERVKILLDTVGGVIHVETTLDKLVRA